MHYLAGVIPWLQNWFIDRMLDDVQRRLADFEWNGKKLSDFQI